MSTPSFFRVWFDDDNADLDDEVARAGYGMVSLHTQIAELSATVSVLMKMLADAGQLDIKVLRYRVEAELDARRAPEEPDAPATMPAVLTCVRCGKKRPPQQTVMTDRGVICDPSCAS